MSYTDHDFETTAASHTPGPWTTHADAPFEVVMDDGDVNPLVATVNACSASVDRPQALADARLIAAAPAMLAALQHLINDLRHPDIRLPGIHEARVLAAIAKATGQ